MATIRRGILLPAPEWRKHLRPWLKRVFWKHHRRAEQRLARAHAALDRDDRSPRCDTSPSPPPSFSPR